MSRWEFHEPVLTEELVSAVGPGLETVSLAVDCTVGGGGHALAVLEAHPEAGLIGIDRDPKALEKTIERLERFGERVRVIRGRFSALEQVLSEVEVEAVGAVYYDLGVSSHQLDERERGFGFRGSHPLDMRMDPSDPLRAEDIVNSYSAEELADVLSRYGEERFARRISEAVVSRRRSRPFRSAEDLAEVVKDAIPAATRRTGGHPARRTFQALRIEVNAELAELQASLPQAIEALSPGGRLAAISYHSLEDRIVKAAMKQASKGCTCPRDLPVCACGKKADLRMMSGKSTRPSDQEIEANPRSRSARMRVGVKLGEAA